MSGLRALPAVLLLAAAAAAQAPREGCGTCHGQEATDFARSVHVASLACTDCHGGDPAASRDQDAAHADSAGFHGRVQRADVPVLCGGCHSDPLRMAPFGLATDQLAKYRVSGHGRALLEHGDAAAAGCTDCHGSHAILHAGAPDAPTAPANQPATCGRCHADAERMAPYGLSPGVVAEFEGSVHGRALLDEQVRGAPACSDCHGAHVAAPPAEDGIVATCTRCHENTGESFRAGPHARQGPIECLSCHADRAGEAAFRVTGCAACHGAHGVQAPDEGLLSGDAPGHCGHCHGGGDAAAPVAQSILSGRQRLRDAMDGTRADLRAAKARGLFLDNEDIYLRESLRTLVAVGPLSHALDAPAIEAHLDDAVKRQDRTAEMIERKAKALRDRALLAGGAAVLLLLLLGLLAVKLDALRKLS
jgi:hypothetical protein